MTTISRRRALIQKRARTLDKSKDQVDLEVRKVVDSSASLLLCQHVQLPVFDFKYQDPALCQQQACQILLPISPPGTNGNKDPVRLQY